MRPHSIEQEDVRVACPACIWEAAQRVVSVAEIAAVVRKHDNLSIPEIGQMVYELHALQLRQPRLEREWLAGVIAFAVPRLFVHEPYAIADAIIKGVEEVANE